MHTLWICDIWYYKQLSEILWLWDHAKWQLKADKVFKKYNYFQKLKNQWINVLYQLLLQNAEYSIINYTCYSTVKWIIC